MLQQDGWYLRNDIIWHKPNSMPESVKDRPYRSHEYLFLLTKCADYSFNNTKLRDSEDNLLRSVWTLNNAASKSTIHSARFPQSLVEICLKSSTRKNSLVLDPFCGIGTVAIACVNFDRRFAGIDVNNDFIKEAKRNIKEAIKIKLASK